MRLWRFWGSIPLSRNFKNSSFNPWIELLFANSGKPETDYRIGEMECHGGNAVGLLICIRPKNSAVKMATGCVSRIKSRRNARKRRKRRTRRRKRRKRKRKSVGKMTHERHVFPWTWLLFHANFLVSFLIWRTFFFRSFSSCASVVLFRFFVPVCHKSVNELKDINSKC